MDEKVGHTLGVLGKTALGAGALGRDCANGGGLGSKEHQELKCKF